MRTLIRKLKQITFLSLLFIITVAFNFQHNPLSNWYQQFLLNVGTRQITDMTFLDSLTGYIVVSVASDTSYVLKTTNGGDEWNIVFRNFFKTTHIQFLNKDTGYVCGSYIFKTTNGGINWIQINNGGISSEAMHVLNQDTLWIILSESLTGGVFRTTNGGLNWTQQFSQIAANPTNIYFYNGNTGFISLNTGASYVRRTTNSGLNWTTVVNGEGFTDMHFTDSLTGWRSYGLLKKTTNGGVNWVTQSLPSQTGLSQITKFSVLNKDTIWGVNGYYVYPNNQGRGVLYTTTNGGTNWYFQVPDTNIRVFQYHHVQFVNRNCGWAYSLQTGIHTKLGGDPFTSINLINSQVPNSYILYKNYPNPFNPSTVISYHLSASGFIIVKVYDIKGRVIAALVNQRQSAGAYSISFDANKHNLSSGIYFYSLQTEKFTETKK